MNWSRTAAAAILLLGFVATVVVGLVPRRSEPPPLLNPATISRSAHVSLRKAGVHLTAAKKFDDAISKIAAQNNLQLVPQADWLTICRRLSLGLLGSGLSFQDIRILEQVPEDQRVDAFLESCLADVRWANYWSERFTRAYVGDNNGPFLLYRRRRFRLWLADQFAADRSYDALVRQLITAHGLWTDHPEVNFYTATADGDENGRADPIRMAGRVSRVFLAKRIDCLQCHDDFVGNTSLASDDGVRPGTQMDFHQLASFFDGVAVRNILAGVDDDGRKYKATLLGETEPTEIDPKVPFVGQIYDNDLKRREAFANWLTKPENEYFSRATVNRVWGLMTGKSLVTPVDDIPEDSEMLEAINTLADSFIENGYSLKELVRIIATSDTFRRGSRSDIFEITDKHEEFLASYRVSRMRPEQIALAIFQASDLNRLSDTSNILEQLGRSDEMQKFVSDFGDLGDQELTGISTTVTQRLLLLNGNATSSATKLDVVANAISRIGSFAKDDRAMIEEVYLIILNRYPSETEMSSILESVTTKLAGEGQTKPNRVATAVDLGYALINSAEMQWNH